MCLVFVKFVKKTVKKLEFVMLTRRRFFRKINYEQKMSTFYLQFVSRCYQELILYCSLNAIVAQPENCPFGVSTRNELRNITTSNNTATIVGWNITR